MWKIFSGRLQLEITSADCISLLNTLNIAKIKLEDVILQSNLIIHITISKNEYTEVVNICTKQGASIKIISKAGIYWHIRSVAQRPVLVTFLVILCMLSFLLPSRIFFISVEGNHTITANQIIEAAEQCGIRFGTSRRQVRSEKMKNALLYALPELQWAGINTSGCTAVISVREKTTQDISLNKKNQVSSIIASRDGIIQNCTVYQGNSLCTVGQAVKAGQVLVSGYLDCGVITKTTQANAEIKALTFREIEVLTPTATTIRGGSCNKRTLYSIRIGKNIINLFEDSGNSDARCGKIYEEKYMQLPGGFQLPIAIIKQTVIEYGEVANQSVISNSSDWITEFTQKYLKDTMIAGEIISQQTELNITDELCYLYGRYACIEMIGQVKVEQTMIGDK